MNSLEYYFSVVVLCASMMFISVGYNKLAVIAHVILATIVLISKIRGGRKDER